MSGKNGRTKLRQIKANAKEKGVDSGSMKKVELIRAIKRAEGYRDCFATDEVNMCWQLKCLREMPVW
jgi:hypothetical protein